MKVIKQVTVFLQNETGRLEELTRILAENSINIGGISIAETAEFGMARMILDDHVKAEKILKENEFSIKLVDVLCVETPDVPKALYGTMKKLADEGINISYMYGHSANGVSHMVMKVSDPGKALEILKR